MVHKVSQDFKDALAGEGWAIQDYTELIADAKTEKAKKVLTEIRDEERHHQVELLDLAKCGSGV